MMLALDSDTKLKATYTAKDNKGDTYTQDYPYTGNRIKDGDYISTFQSAAILYTENEGRYTEPNLHRRIDATHDAKMPYPEYENRSHVLQIQGLNSYRTTKMIYHNEDDDVEIP